MNKADFIESMKEIGGYDKKVDAEKALKAFIGAVEKVLESNESIELAGFGKFENNLQKGKTGKVPGTDKTYKTEDKFVPRFRPSKTLKDKISKVK
ncbi:DNA-binding protein [Helicobacter sp. 13S00401-1]|uniref:HU family DNA-binding protein n=1 Tax=unclassified Helicobacter TaxID=2593540 RepID=UPI000BA63DEE|nr:MULTISPECIES: HU family DNA-binding protein [unclassified Helicobacter]PAF45497.1 DNA-binding protein [Helicobacter sp. 11S02629-2]PAF50927.1 DNA-binding protein [Helicobacter sp. 13S00401-1]